jgi:hypothetical protein
MRVFTVGDSNTLGWAGEDGPMLRYIESLSWSAPAA